MTEQQCTRCGVWYPLTSFSRSRTRKSGRQPWCKFCATRYAQARKAAQGRTGRAGATLRATPTRRAPERAWLFCEIPLDLKQEVVTACRADNVTLISIVCELLEDWLANREEYAA